jgi:hypothetical protein
MGAQHSLRVLWKTTTRIMECIWSYNSMYQTLWSTLESLNLSLFFCSSSLIYKPSLLCLCLYLCLSTKWECFFVNTPKFTFQSDKDLWIWSFLPALCPILTRYSSPETFSLSVSATRKILNSCHLMSFSLLLGKQAHALQKELVRK